MEAFSEFQRQSLLSGCMSLSHRVAELEARIAEAESAPRLSGIKADLSPVERRIALDYFARLREELLRVLETNDIDPPTQQTSLRWVLQTGLVGMQVAVDELGPSSLRGYGPLSAEGGIAAERLQQQLNRNIDQARRLLAQRSSVDLPNRLRNLAEETPHLAAAIRTIDAIISRRALLEFRPQVEAIVNRLETARLEVAVCGRVSSGKSSLLNHVAGQDVLPVGVLPVTAVPTRLTWGPQPLVRVDFADGESRQVDLAELEQFAAEQSNPQNTRHVSRIDVRLPSSRLQEGIVFVDTPGLGSLARSGSAETLAYLPHCDLAIVLVDAAAAINDEDLKVIRLLVAGGIPLHVLLSKVDLIKDDERQQVLDYVQRMLHQHIGASVPVYLISTVGRYESLFDEWFEREIQPLRLRHQQLSWESIRTKTARLADALEDALQQSRRRQGLAAVAASPADLERVRHLLQEGDDTLRQLDAFVPLWREEVPLSLETVFNRAAAAVAGTNHHGASLLTAVKLAVNDVLADHARLIWGTIQEKHGKLRQTVEALAAAGPATHVDSAGFQQLPWEPLPIADWTPVKNGQPQSRSWWLSLRLLVATAAVRQRLERDFSRQVGEAVAAYDRLLDRWLRGAFHTLRTAYEAQTEIVRGGLNRRAAPASASAEQDDTIDDDLQRLKEILTPAPQDDEQHHACSDDCRAHASEAIRTEHPKGAL